MEGFAVRRGGCRGSGQLDAALAELGMLATVTDARREYLQEALSVRENNKDSVHHLHFNSSLIHSHNVQQDNASWGQLGQGRMLRRLIRDEKRRLLKGQGHLPQEQHSGQQQQHRLTSISLGVPPSSYKGWDTERTVPLISLARKDVKYFPQRTHRSASVSRARHLFMPYDRGAGYVQPRPYALLPVSSAADNHSEYSFHPHNQGPIHHLHPTVGLNSSDQHHSPTSSHLTGLQLPTLRLPIAGPQNKSNPPSPVKSNPLLLDIRGGNGSLAGIGAPLVRSKSLDNIAFCPLTSIVDESAYELNDYSLNSSASMTRQMTRVDTIVESVSSRISSLQLTAN
ncbi:uncharacterized protein LOC111262444 isoform X3 [Varroa jacobsoni]|uniref:uncharacterized protein LOC111262444 isoform X3 n=1 Tax=Varroa jacobsoni TaxID=62625 RepID=UPI000BF9C674|nr:uncharacterized protein LOC111262444 isoform X3 [Varroa jacobsoni]XP_022692452.1 uncharacterized protein LOC111262444 isoform X3 [Varroa jacobsoni]XP_022692453.1 uncharacterized protein LOC111262444 isoform X3 [Varroa jacobsoni]